MAVKVVRAFIHMNNIKHLFKPLRLLGTLLAATMLWLLVGTACNNDLAPQDPLPFVPVDVEINLQDLRYIDLRRVGGWVYEPGGIDGLIIYRAPNNVYRAFERRCTYRFQDSCAIVQVDPSELFLSGCCGEQFNFEGQPQGPNSNVPLRQYFTQIQGNFLFITNAL